MDVMVVTTRSPISRGVYCNPSLAVTRGAEMNVFGDTGRERLLMGDGLPGSSWRSAGSEKNFPLAMACENWFSISIASAVVIL